MISTTKWRLTVAAASLVVVLSFGVLFTTDQSAPFLFSLPYVFWMGILTTTLLVVLTFLGTKAFPYKED